MARVAGLFTNFTGGEISPRLEGRVDLAKYREGCRTMLNMVPQFYGGARRRPGTRFVREVKDSTKKVRLIPFVFSTLQSYIIEAGPGYFRFYKDGGIIISGGSPVEIATPYTETQLPEINWVQSADVMWITHPSHKPRKLTRTSHTAWTLTEASLIGGPWLSENATDTTMKLSAATGTGVTLTASASYFVSGHVGSIFKLREATGALPYKTWAVNVLVKENEIRKYDGRVYKQTTAVTNLTGTWQRSGSTIRITLTDHGLITGQRVNIDFTTGTATDGTYGVTIIDKDTVEIIDLSITQATGAAKPNFGIGGSGGLIDSSGNCTVERTSIATGNSAPIHTEGTVTDGFCSWLYLHDGTVQVQVTAVASGTSATVNVIKNTAPDSVVSSNTTKYWTEGAFSTLRGWPSVAAFHEQRLYYAATTHQPQTVWGSVSGDFDNFTASSLDDGALGYTIAADDVQTIRALVPGKVMSILTQNAEFVLRASGTEQSITPTNFAIVRATAFGTQANVRPRQVGPSTLFVQAGGRKVRELVYQFEQDNYAAPDMTLLAEHITLSGVIDTAWQREPDPILWCVRADGALLGMTYERSQNVVAWHRHKLGGDARNVSNTTRATEAGDERVTQSGDTRTTEAFDDSLDADVDAVATIPRASDDQVWIIVKRYINGNLKRYVEYFTSPAWTAAEDACCVDSSLSYDGEPVNSVSGLSHLEGQTVAIWADGEARPNQVVASGAVSLGGYASHVEVGLPYTSILETTRLELGAQDGTAQGRPKRIHQLVARVLDSGSFYAGPNADELDPVTVAPATGETLYTGEVELAMPGGWETEGRVYLKQTGPAPMNILLLAPRMTVHER